jgi:hypothetical protein
MRFSIILQEKIPAKGSRGFTSVTATYVMLVGRKADDWGRIYKDAIVAIRGNMCLEVRRSLQY